MDDSIINTRRTASTPVYLPSSNRQREGYNHGSNTMDTYQKSSLNIQQKISSELSKDLDAVEESLVYVNQFQQRTLKSKEPISLLEIFSNGESNYTNKSLFDLLSNILSETRLSSSKENKFSSKLGDVAIVKVSNDGVSLEQRLITIY